YLVVRWNKQIEFYTILNCSFNYLPDYARRNSIHFIIFYNFIRLTFAFNKKMVFLIHKNAGDQITQIVCTVVFKRIGKKIIDVYCSAIGTKRIVFNICCVPNRMLVIELENIGVHTKNEQITGNFKFGFKWSAIFINRQNHFRNLILYF